MADNLLAAWSLDRALQGDSDVDHDPILAAHPDCPIHDLALVRDWLLTRPDVNEAMMQIDPNGPAPSDVQYATWADLDTMLSSITWGWDEWLANGFLTIIAGSQEMGKSLLALRVVGCFTKGLPWPDGTEFTGKRGRVVWAEGEAGQRLNLDRAKRWDMDLTKIITPHRDIGDFSFENQEHRDHLWDIMSKPDVRLGIIDSLSGIHGGKESDAEMQRIVKPFAELARDQDKPMIINHHVTKPRFGEVDILTLARVRGSGTITQTARAVWGIDIPDPEGHPDVRRLHMLKTNLGVKPEPLGFTIGDKGVAFCDAPEAVRTETVVDKAGDLLLSLLDREPMKHSKIKTEAQGAGISWRAIERAKKRLRIVATKRVDGWWWGLPSKEEP